MTLLATGRNPESPIRGVAPAEKSVSVLIPFNASGFLYGMERAVIELFDSMRPRIAPHFLMSHWTFRERLPILAEVQRRGLSYSFFSDTSPWLFGRPRSLSYTWKQLLALMKGNRDVLKQAVRCDALYLPGTRYAVLSVLACVYCRLTGRRVIYQFHNLVPYRSRALWLLRFLVRDFIHMTETGYRLTSEANPCLLKSNNHVIPLVIHLPDTGGSDDLPETLSRGRRTILFVGQVSWHKGIDVLLQAMALMDGHPDVVLLIIGGCTPEFKPSFDALLADERIAGRVVYVGYRQDPFRFMTHAYVQVLPTPPSRYLEGAPRTILEAMACGLPTICFRSGGAVDLVVHRETGLICDREDAECLAENLRLFLDDRQFRDCCSANATARFRTVYSPQGVAAGWERLLAGH